jgi:hypothetical protein
VGNLIPMLADDDPCVRAAVVRGVGAGSLGMATLTLAAEKVLELMGYEDLPKEEQAAYAGVCRSAQHCLKAILTATDDPAPLMELAQQQDNPLVCHGVIDLLAVMSDEALLAHASYIETILIPNADKVRLLAWAWTLHCTSAAPFYCNPPPKSGHTEPEVD